MKKLYTILVCFVLLFAVASCKSTKPTVTKTETQTKTITEKIHDTIFKIEKDSSSYKALLECQNGKVVVKEVIQSEPGRKLKSPKVRVENNKLNVDCQLDEQKLYAFWKSTQVQDVQYRTITVTKFINQLTFWQEFQIKGFRILSILILALVIGLIIKSKLKL
jgi:hypothetical protein